MTQNTLDQNPTRMRNSRTIACALSLTLLPLLTVTGCHKTVDDATLTNNVKSALSGDATISQQPVQVAVQSGVVTLTGNVTDDTARSVSAQDAARVAGVKEVVNNMTVAGIAVAPTVTSPSAPTNPRRATLQERDEIARHGTLSAPNGIAPAPPQPVYRDVTLRSGSEIPVRITETLDSATTESGAPFNGVVTHEIDADGLVVIPAGAAVSGTVVDAKDATHFKGSSSLSIQLTSIRRHGQVINVSSDPYTVQGKGRGVNTAEKVGGGAAIGAVLGGIFGGGKGAAIGAAAGGGGGAVYQGLTHGQQVTIPSETVVRFQLASPLTVRASEAASTSDPNANDTTSPGLQRR